MIAIIAVTTLKASLILFGRKAGWSWVHFALGLRAPPQKRIYLSSIMYFEIWYICLFSFFIVLIMYFEIWYICLFSFFIVLMYRTATWTILNLLYHSALHRVAVVLSLNQLHFQVRSLLSSLEALVVKPNFFLIDQKVFVFISTSAWKNSSKNHDFVPKPSTALVAVQMGFWDQ